MLLMINIITFLLGALASQVLSQSTDIFPARILVQQKTISEHSDLYVTCSTFGQKKKSMIFIYLWKDGLAIKRMIQKQGQNDTTININRVSLQHSGNYSCVYSPKNYTLLDVTERGTNIIQIVVIDISAVGPSTVHEGEYVEFRCTLSDSLHTLGDCQLIHSYLRKNETILLVQAFNVARMEATFTIEGAVLRDAGHYSCMVLPSKCIQENENTLHGKNTVFLEVKVDVVPQLLVLAGVITLMLSLSLSVWWMSIKLGRSASCKPCATGQQTNADMLEEQQEQTQGEDLEEWDEERDSFSEEEVEEYVNNPTAEGPSYSHVSDGMYSVIESDNPPDDFHAYCADEIAGEYDDIDLMFAN